MGLPVVGDEGARHAVAGIVDQPVHLQAALIQFVDQPLRCLRVGQVIEVTVLRYASSESVYMVSVRRSKIG